MKKKLKKLGCVFTLILMPVFCFSFIAGCNEDDVPPAVTEVWGEVFTLDTAYTEAVRLGYTGTLQEFIDSISGKKGDKGQAGENGKSAYELAVENGYEGTLEQWLQSLVGTQGQQGVQGVQGNKGDKGDKGETGQSAYELAVENGYEGTLEQWLQSLVGSQGLQGVQGLQGIKGDKGETGETGETGANGKSAYELYLELEGLTEEECSVEQWLNSLTPNAVIGMQITKDNWGIRNVIEVLFTNQNGEPQTYTTLDTITSIKPNIYYEAKNSNEIWYLIESGVEKIKLANDVHLSGNTEGTSLRGKTRYVYRAVFNKDLQLNLNSHKLIVDNAFDITINNNAEVIFKNGSVERRERTQDTKVTIGGVEKTFKKDLDVIGYADPAIKLENGASLTLNKVSFYSFNGPIHLYNKSTLNVINSQINIGFYNFENESGEVSYSYAKYSGSYAISTNASTDKNTGKPIDSDVTINITNSSVETTNTISTGILFNIPGNLNINNSKITGNIQAVIARGGKTIISNSTLNCKGNFDNAEARWETDWASGSCVPFSVLVVGNKTSDYQYETECVLYNTVILKQGNTTALIAIAGNAGENNNGIKNGTWIGATLIFDDITMDRSGFFSTVGPIIKTYAGNENCYKMSSFK